MDQEEIWIGIYRETVGPLYAYVSRRSGGAAQLAEDVVQEAYLRAIARFGREEAPRNPLAWLCAVARNFLVSYFRRGRPTAIDPSTLDGMLARSGVETRAEAALVHVGLARVGRRHRQVLEAFHLDGKDVRAISRELGISERAVEGRLRRGRQALRRHLQPFVDPKGEE